MVKNAVIHACILLMAFLGVRAALPSKIYGVNLGSWLLLEPWMLPAEWKAMGGEQCDDCSTCIATEFAFARAFPSTVDAIFNKHWTTWFTQSDVNNLKAAGINTVRLPLGYWIVEDLVDRKTEFYPRQGFAQLRRGLTQLNNSNIKVILDHHALPGVHTPNQMFAGRCTTDVQFYTPANYGRALTWTAVMTTMSHLDPAFTSVAAIQAVNEIIMDANLTPGYGTFQKNFVKTVRNVEQSLQATSGANITQALKNTAAKATLSAEEKAALLNAVPILLKLADQFGIQSHFAHTPVANVEPLITNFMDINWQHNSPANPADAANGPQAYDNHLYYSFGGVADPNEDAYMTHICNLDRVEQDAELRNTPLWFGEWALSTQFDASDEFLSRWADAQKLAYSKANSAGWLFWNFKVEISSAAGDLARQWSYLEGVRRGFFTKDPSKLNDPTVCDAYTKNATSRSV